MVKKITQAYLMGLGTSPATTTNPFNKQTLSRNGVVCIKSLADRPSRPPSASFGHL